MIILLSNDDGIHAPGLHALEKSLAPLGETYVVAPDRERNAIGHALTLHRPLRVNELGPRRYAVDGTPTDCVHLAINAILPARPQLVVSGINHGANLGDDVTYSGTVAAALEGALLGVSAIAVSLSGQRGLEFATAAEFSVALVSAILRHGLPAGSLLNVNVPNLPREQVRGVRITRQGKRPYSDVVAESADPRGRRFFWIGGEKPDLQDEDGTDVASIRAAEISITPLVLDWTNYRALNPLEALTLDWP